MTEEQVKIHNKMCNLEKELYELKMKFDEIENRKDKCPVCDRPQGDNMPCSTECYMEYMEYMEYHGIS